MHESLVQILTLDGSPLLRAAGILAAIVSLITAYKQSAHESAGAAGRHLGVQQIAFVVMATYMVLVIVQYVKILIDGMSIQGIDFS